MDTAVEAMQLLGAGQFFNPKESSSLEFWRQISKGLPTESVEMVMLRVPVAARNQWRGIIANKGRARNLSPEQSEHAGRLAYILALSKEVWGTWSAANDFLMRPHKGLDNKTPMEATTSERGSREVEALLRRIQFGLPA